MSGWKTSRWRGTPPPRSHPTRGLDDEAGSEGCIPPDSNSPRQSTPPPIHLEGEILQVPVSPLWPVSSATGFYQTPETSGGVPETNRPSYIIIYLDDMLFTHASKEQLAAMATLICRLFKAVGLMVNMKKSLLTPTQIIEFLGFQISFCALTLSLPPENSRKIQLKAQTLLKCQTLPARDLTVFIGKVVATSKALQQAPLYYRALHRGLNSQLTTPQDHP